MHVSTPVLPLSLLLLRQRLMAVLTGIRDRSKLSSFVYGAVTKYPWPRKRAEKNAGYI